MMKTGQELKTPQETAPALAKALGMGKAQTLYLKREDLYPLYASHKGRSIPPMIDSYIAEGFSQFAISSSGNGALAAALHIKELNGKKLNEKTARQVNEKIKTGSDERSLPLRLTIFIGTHINAEKLKKLRELQSESGGALIIEQVEKPVRALLEKTEDSQVKSLRQSTNPRALAGYEALAEELLEIPDLRAVFVPSSSGTTAQGLGQAFAKHGKPVQIHIVQTEQVHTLIDEEKIAKKIADNGEKSDKKTADNRGGENNPAHEQRSLADAIVDTVGHRKNAVREMFHKNGGGWIVNNAEIESAMRLVEKTVGLDISANSALSVAGLQKALAARKKESRESLPAKSNFLDGAIVCLITGA